MKVSAGLLHLVLTNTLQERYKADVQIVKKSQNLAKKNAAQEKNDSIWIA